MAVQNGEKYLPDYVLYMWHGKWLAFLIQVLLHVKVEVLKDEIYFVLSVHDVHQVDDTRMVQLLQQRHLPDGSARYSLVGVLYLYLFKGNNLKKREKMSESMAQSMFNCV